MTESTPPLLDAPDEVLSTLNPDGSRRWIRPRLIRGRWWKRRAVVAWSLIALFNVLPWIQIGGKPLLRLDVVAREFTFFTVTFRPTETLLLTFLLLTVFLSIFLLTALLGRVWCGWGCPQTVYLEFLFRPLERLIGGKAARKGEPLKFEQKLLKFLIFGLICFHLAHTFLAYFVGPQEVMRWSMGEPSEHLPGFLIVVGITGLMMFDFLYFREQMCILACPYGRLQSVLLDRKSLIVGYDVKRGEPRGKLKKSADPATPKGDCVDCGWCTAVCPTGIDIRKGLQMECLHCTECIDACDDVMTKVGKPKGLIRYSSQDGLEGGKTGFLRARTVLYPVALAVLITLFVVQLGKMQSATLLPRRVQGTPYSRLDDGRVRSMVAFRLENRAGETRTYQVSSSNPEVELSAPTFPMTLDPGESNDFSIVVIAPFELFERGKAIIPFVFEDGVDFKLEKEHNIPGPYTLPKRP